MRAAFAGKGGSGKSTIVGTVARLWARDGDGRTVVLDSDVMPGLAGALGIPPSDAPIPDEVVEASDVEGQPPFRLRTGLSAEQAVAQYAIEGPDDVLLVQLGKLRTDGVWTLRGSQHAFRQIARELPRDGWHVLGDLPGGTRQPFFGWGRFADVMVVVVEPTVKSFMTARRIGRLATEPDAPRVVAVANKVTSDADRRLVADETGLEVIAAIPADPAVRDADRRGLALVDHAPTGPATGAIGSLAVTLREMVS